MPTHPWVGMWLFFMHPYRLLPCNSPFVCVIIRVKRLVYGETSVTRAKEPSQPRVTFYTKAGCHLCDEARDMLDDIAAQSDFELTEVDIRSNPKLFEEYRYRIPVIIINDDTILEGRIDFSNLAKAFQLP
ncbi:MAG: glutaredoxin family protein [Chloroflexi bacterium]|nr:MAG: glutaredoxin family protein [Chloroflexota bacterium]